MELKNPWTHQTVYHAREQYKTDRDPKEPLLQFARCVVHFAVDTEEVWMTTKLDKKDTYFLPLNRGDNYGKGNPPNPTGHTYLIQHSAGSGKSHSIAWTAYQLIELYPSGNLPDRAADLPLFD
jgi:type I site-specific restriction-modification system R (restriction) subunit